MKRHFPIVTAMLSLLSSLAVAQEARSPAQEIAPFIDDQTLGVVCIDLAKVDLAASQKWLAGLLDAASVGKENRAAIDREITQGLSAAGNLLDTLRKAGACRVFILLSPADIEDAPVVITLSPQADPKTIAAVFPDPTRKSEVIKQALVLSYPEKLASLKTLKPDPRPDLEAALSGSEGVQLALLMTRDARHVIETSMPRLPREIGGGPITTFTHGLHWARLSLTLPPEPRIALVIQSQSEHAAEDFARLLHKVIEQVLALPEVKSAIGDTTPLLALLKPVAADGRVELTLDAATITQRIAPQLIRSFQAARQAVRDAAALNQVQQITTGLLYYTSGLKKPWPDSLEAFVKSGEFHIEFLKGPAGMRGFVYLKPDPKADPAKTVIVHEAYDAWPGKVIAGFLDGHVEAVTDPSIIKKMKR